MPIAVIGQNHASESTLSTLPRLRAGPQKKKTALPRERRPFVNFAESA